MTMGRAPGKGVCSTRRRGTARRRWGRRPSVLVRMRAKLRGSTRPDRIFEVALEAARDAGLDSTPLYDAVATQDTVTMIRSAIRGLRIGRQAGVRLE